MQLTDGTILISSRDLIAELECDHRLHLEWSVLVGKLPRMEPEDSPELELLIDKGIAHEESLSKKYSEEGSFVEINKPAWSKVGYEKAMAETMAAIKAGTNVIAQAAFYTGTYLAFVDFLILNRDEDGKPILDEEGRFVYDPVDAKSARTAKRAAVLQVASYAQVMVELGLATPKSVRLWLSGDSVWSTPARNVMDLAALFMERVKGKLASYISAPDPIWAAPRESCSRCKWSQSCDTGRHKDRDLSLIQEIRSTARTAIIDAGIQTIDDLAEEPIGEEDYVPEGVSRSTFTRLVKQAEIQVRGKDADRPIHDLRNPETLANLPTANPGDVWFDMEGDPFAENGEGLEYMFGVFWTESISAENFETFDAVNRESEGKAFQKFMEWILARRQIHPNMHIYHYASYEKSALLRLAQRHGIVEDEVDRLLREGVMIDLYAVIRKAFLFSTESLSIKSIEAIYQEERGDDQAVVSAVGSVIEFENALVCLQAGEEVEFKRIVQNIREYNRVDCSSTQKLNSWIREQMVLLGISPCEPGAQSEESLAGESDSPVADGILEYVPQDQKNRSDAQQGLALVAASLRYHVRESKPAWQTIFERAGKDLDELEDYDDVVVIGDISSSEWSKTGRQRVFHRNLSVQSPGPDFSMLFSEKDRPYLLYDPALPDQNVLAEHGRGITSAKIESLTATEIEFDETSKFDSSEQLPIAILPQAPINAKPIPDFLNDLIGSPALIRLEKDLTPFEQTCWSDILLRKLPRQKSGSLPASGDFISDITAALLDSDRSYVAVQGPPGTGKTHVGAHVIVELIQKGWRIGVVAQSHSVVENLLDKVRNINAHVPIAKEPATGGPTARGYHVDVIESWINERDASRTDIGFVVGGTAWTFCANDIRGYVFDLMVIDEAGQFSLANSLGVLAQAKCALLLGDPQQLPQVSQAIHVEPVETSVLSHVLGEAPTIDSDRGYFLEKSFRMHPDLCDPVSKLQYEDRLESHERCSMRELENVKPGLNIISVDHVGNTTASDEEAKEAVQLVNSLLGRQWKDIDGDDRALPPRPLRAEDILIVTPYNRQVRKIKATLAAAHISGIQVGTVDKFQGKEAPVVIVSMTTSSSQDLPRGIEFLLDPHRLNVAISRAQWACFLMRSPQLSIMEPNSVEGIVRLGKFVSLCKGRLS